MAISVTWGTKVINIPKADMTLIQSSPFEIRELNIDTFRLVLKDLEDDADGMTFEDTHRNIAPITVGALTLGRVIEIINGYTITFENLPYGVNVVGGNSNIADKVNRNQVSVYSFNSAGLVQIVSGSGLSVEQDAKLTAIKEDTTLLSSEHALSKAALLINTVIDQCVYDTSNPPRLLSSRIRSYATSGEAQNPNSSTPIATLTATETYVGAEWRGETRTTV